MMKKFVFALCAVLCATMMMAQSGISCNDPIPVGNNYEGKIDGPCTIWYTANTYDLPLHVYFVPDSANSKMSPEIYVDFTCSPGVYDDPKLDSLLNKMSIFGVELPIEFMCDPVTYQGRNAWELSISNSYREELSQSGITYNVPAYVQVNFFESGSITMTPDTVFSSCVENSKKVYLGDTLNILPNDSDRIFLLPYTDWAKDSIQFVWNGEGSARVWLATGQCDFTPVTNSSYVWGYYDVLSNVPYKLQSTDINAAIKDAKAGGLFYCKILSKTAGSLVVESIPVTPPAGGAILLEYDKPVSVSANGNEVFAFPKTWALATMFESPLAGDFKAQVSNSYCFVDSIGVFVNTFAATSYDELAVHLSSAELSLMTGKAKDNYLYVRFVTENDMTITPKLWSVSPCVDKSRSLVANDSFEMNSTASTYYYRLRYDDFVGYDLTVDWTGSSQISVYIGDTCKFNKSSSNKYVVYYERIAKKSASVISAETIASWSSRVDEEGYLYVQFSSVNGDVTFQTEKPAPITSPCVLASTLLEPSAALTINLDKAFDIYRIDYQAWLASGVKLVWTGVSPLHTFVAKDCEFAVAIYHKDVVNYTEVPAEGNVILSKDILATLGQYVDEDGYLYIRFLTELEGILTTAKAE